MINDLYQQLGLIESTLSTYNEQIKLLKIQKKFILKTIEEYANQNIHSESGKSESNK